LFAERESLYGLDRKEVGGSLLLFLRRCGHARFLADALAQPVANINIA
jgi:hypothetical protein